MDSVELTLEDKENLINFLDRVPLTGHNERTIMNTIVYKLVNNSQEKKPGQQRETS